MRLKPVAPISPRSAHRKPGSPPARLEGERGRTSGQLRLFAAHIRKGDYLDRRHDEALPDRQPAPRPELVMVQRPHWPGYRFRRIQFPARIFDGGRRYGRRAGGWLPGRGERA